MPIPNPYGVTKRTNAITNIQTSIPSSERHKLAVFAPNKGDCSAILNSLLNNLILDIHDITAGHYTAIDYTTIAAVLLERRPLSAEQYDRLRSSSCRANVPARDEVHNLGGSSGVRERTEGVEEVPSNALSRPRHGKPGTGKKSPRHTEGA